jgi:16S rRNA (guanine(966)-N(2))-methyltransferase RsmD
VRIIAGSAKGRQLKGPKAGEVRPTADRVKETIFNVLGQWLDDETVLDLYAGIGGLGLEALSRGAKHVTFVEHDREVMAVLADNARTLGFSPKSTTLLRPVDKALRQLAGAGSVFSLVFSDPPYAGVQGGKVLTALDEGGLVTPGGRVVIEHGKREGLPERVGALERVDERKFGDTLVSIYVRRLHPAPPDEPSTDNS